MGLMQRLTLIAASLAVTATVQAADLAEHRWRERVILVHVSDGQQAAWQRLEAVLRARASDLRERDVVVYVVGRSGETWREGVPLSRADAEALRRRIDLPPDTVQLIGKDGGVKLSQPLAQADLEGIFRTIDEMPMRQWEMQNRR